MRSAAFALFACILATFAAGSLSAKLVMLVDGFRPLTHAEAQVEQFGVPLSGYVCSSKTENCPTATAISDPCPAANTPAKCAKALCAACSLGSTYKVCDVKTESKCDPYGDASTQPCGFRKEADCVWATGCSCPGLPANFSNNPCYERDCL